MRCEDCGLELDPKWKYCPDCGEIAPESEADKAERKAKHEARMLADPVYRASIERARERNKAMRPLMDAMWDIHAKDFTKGLPTPINVLKGNQ